MTENDNKYLLPTAKIFMDVYELTKNIFIKTSNFPRSRRYVLGNKIDELFLDFLLRINDVILKIKDYEKRYIILKDLSDKLDKGRLLIRFAHDSEVMSSTHYYSLVEPLEEVGRQLGGFIN